MAESEKKSVDASRRAIAGALCAVAAMTLALAAVILGRYVLFSTEFATDFDGGSHLGASNNPGGIARALAITGSLSGLAALVLGPHRWRAVALALLVLLGGPVWLVTVQLLHYYR